LSNYKTCRKYGANFNILLHDLWGADTTQSSSDPMPGDNGDWASFDSFLERLFADIKSNDMTAGMVWDIWNEPDVGAFWSRPQFQWIQMWGRCYYKIR